MSLAVVWGENNAENGGMVYFDAVTLYTQNYTGQVTKHPVDSGSNITDHFIKDNPKFTIQAVITGVDVSTGTYLITDLSGNTPFNTREAPSAVSVNSTDTSVLKNLIPDSIGQYLSDSTPAISMDTARADLINQIRDLLINLMSGVVLNEKTGQFDPNIQILRLFEFNGTFLNRIINNLVMTSITFDERPETGYALYCNMTFEQVTFAFLKKTQIPQDVSDSLKKKSSSTNGKGKQDSTVKDADNPPSGEESPRQTDRDGLRTPYGDVVNEKQFELGRTLDTGEL